MSGYNLLKEEDGPLNMLFIWLDSLRS